MLITMPTISAAAVTYRARAGTWLRLSVARPLGASRDSESENIIRALAKMPLFEEERAEVRTTPLRIPAAAAIPMLSQAITNGLVVRLTWSQGISMRMIRIAPT